ncbi:hypothetical protein PLESTB_000699200 [Pleodorina starrii]|uniref:Uncharacterized protein n=1 Tax=Pleodorina starrii TaxID=330485 RepID=A0A9W6BJK8_9CHLO|nr:hypothetical protein PLESTB_000699200 [Pleodorina starrii]
MRWGIRTPSRKPGGVGAARGSLYKVRCCGFAPRSPRSCPSSRPPPSNPPNAKLRAEQYMPEGPPPPPPPVHQHHHHRTQHHQHHHTQACCSWRREIFSAGSDVTSACKL